MLRKCAARLLVALIALCAWPALGWAAAPQQCVAGDWPLWQQFARHFIEPDGRVVDYSVPEMHSTSEGQSYGMFFALVANDRPAFDRMWSWSIANLMGSDVTSRLPAWRWGRLPDGSWGELDPNAASDADLWFAYALLEAARLWREPRYKNDARALLKRVRAEEVVELPGLGPMLLPGPIGFALENQVWRLNPSYLPIPVLRRLALHDPAGPWNQLAENTAHMLAQVSPHGLVADWVAYQGLSPRNGHFVIDPVKGDTGSYDAIRVYLWAGMTARSDALAEPVMRAVGGMAAITAGIGAPPELVSSATGIVSGRGNIGFAAALLPYLPRAGQAGLAAEFHAQVQARLEKDAAPGVRASTNYYEYMLSLFGLGFADGKYRFQKTGALQVSWENACRSGTKR